MVKAEKISVPEIVQVVQGAREDVVITLTRDEAQNLANLLSHVTFDDFGGIACLNNELSDAGIRWKADDLTSYYPQEGR